MTEKTKVPDLMANLEESLSPREMGEALAEKHIAAMHEAVADVVAEKRTQGPQTYVVQIASDVNTTRDGRTEPCWRDVATVTVPPRTKRSAVVKQALAKAGITPEPGKPAPRVRVLDEESAFVHEPEAKQPPAEWVIG